MSRTGSLVVLASILATPGLAGHRCDHDREFHRRTCGNIEVSSPNRPRARERFSATKTLDLQFEMRLRDREDDDEGPHVVTFRVLTPKGHLYQQIATEQRQVNRRVSRVSASLPVAGTFITTSSLYGRWRVVPHLDDDPEPCAAGAVFSIVE